MKQIVILLIIFTCFSSYRKLGLCGKDEKLEFEREDYSGDGFRIDGFYYGSPVKSGNEYYCNVLIFFQNGVICLPGAFKEPKIIFEKIIENVDYLYERSWGLFRISNNNILVNSLERTTCNDRSMIYEGKVLNDTTFIFTKKNGKEVEEILEYKFQVYPHKPDSTNNFIK